MTDGEAGPLEKVRALPRAGRDHHPGRAELESFMRGGLSEPGMLAIVRHLLAGCPECVAATRRLWFGDGDPHPGGDAQCCRQAA